MEIQNLLGAILKRSEHGRRIPIVLDLPVQAAHEVEHLGLVGARFPAKRFEGAHVERHGFHRVAEAFLNSTILDQRTRLVGEFYHVRDPGCVGVPNGCVKLRKLLVRFDMIAKFRRGRENFPKCLKLRGGGYLRVHCYPLTFFAVRVTPNSTCPPRWLRKAHTVMPASRRVPVVSLNSRARIHRTSAPQPQEQMSSF